MLAGESFVAAQDAQPSDARLSTQVGGHGEPELLFLADPAAPAAVWDHVVARFEVGYRCHVLTWADSDGGPDAMAAAVAAYARDQKLTRPVLIGHGPGGGVALKVALLAPELPGRLVLVDSLPLAAGDASVEASRRGPAEAGLLAADLRRIHCPTLVLAAQAGPSAARRRVYRRQYRDLPKVRFVFFEKARACLMVDDIEGFTDALRRELTVRGENR